MLQNTNNHKAQNKNNITRLYNQPNIIKYRKDASKKRTKK